jgi:hypothetical protein
MKLVFVASLLLKHASKIKDCKKIFLMYMYLMLEKKSLALLH